MTTTTVNTTQPHDYYLSIRGQNFHPDFTGIPTIEDFLDDETPIGESTVFAHYFAPGYDFWLLALDADTGIAYGKVRNIESEFGTVDLKELCTIQIHGFPVEREVDITSAFRVFMKPKLLSQFHTGTDTPVTEWFAGSKFSRFPYNDYL